MGYLKGTPDLLIFQPEQQPIAVEFKVKVDRLLTQYQPQHLPHPYLKLEITLPYHHLIQKQGKYATPEQALMLQSLQTVGFKTFLVYTDEAFKAIFDANTV